VTRSSALKGAVAGLFALAMLLSFPGLASAAPTASVTYSPSAPLAAAPVTFTFTGTCDVAPCAIQWRWFKSGGSSLGTTLGDGPVVTYAFAAAGTYSVVAKITNGGSTHNFATATHAITVRSRPVADFDADGSSDIAVYRPSTGI